MEIINHEHYVSLETAKLLKEAGFDWEIKSFYFNNELCETMLGEAKNHNFSEQFISAPTLDAAQRWLREEHYFHIFVEYDSWSYFCRIDQCEPACLYKHREWIHNCKEFSTYEEAQEAGIKKALEMILEKGE